MSDTTARQADDPSDFGPGNEGREARWGAEIQACDRDRKPWLKRCQEIERRYRNDPHYEGTAGQKLGTRFAVLWSNIQTLGPAVYTRPPVPVVSRRFRDTDPVARAASMILQRSLSYVAEEAHLHELMATVRDDFLLYARGAAWARYEPHFKGSPSDEGMQVAGSEEDEAEPVDELDWEEVDWDFVARDDFLHGPGKVWSDVTWVGRVVRMTKAAGRKRFGRKFNDVSLSWKPSNMTDQDIDRHDEVIRRAEVIEIWDKTSGQVLWFADPFNEITFLERVDDPLKLSGFFPTPKPLFGTMTSGTLIPVPDYAEYQDQAAELDELTQRISGLTAAIKVSGAYNSRYPELARIFDEGMENQLVPIDQWDDFASKNGMAGSIDMVDLKPLIETLQALIQSRSQVKSDLYEITGIADIIRGSSQPNETATAQRIKGRYATLRLSEKQLEVARYVRDMLRITGEIIAENYSPETLRQISNYDESALAQEDVKDRAQQQQAYDAYVMQQHQAMMAAMQQQIGGLSSSGPVSPMAGGGGGTAPPPGLPMQQGVPGGVRHPPQAAPALQGAEGPRPPSAPPQPPGPPLFDRAIALLRNDKLRGFRVDIEDQSTIAMDDAEEKQGRVEFLTSIGKFIGEAAMLPPNLAPVMLPMLGKLLLFGARGFRAGLEMESTIEDTIEQLVTETNKPKPPSPDMLKAQQDAKMGDAEIALKQMQAQQQAQLAQAEMAMKQQQAQLSAQQSQSEQAMKMLAMKHQAAQEQAQNAQDATQHQIAIDTAMLERERFQLEQQRAENEHALAVAKLQLEQQRLQFEREKMALTAMDADRAHEAATEGVEAEADG